jgi:ferredoxin
MRISVDNALCDAHGQCNMIDEELFPLDDEGYSAVGKGREVPPGEEDSAEQGIYNCPVSALTVDAE